MADLKPSKTAVALKKIILFLGFFSFFWLLFRAEKENKTNDQPKIFIETQTLAGDNLFQEEERIGLRSSITENFEKTSERDELTKENNALLNVASSRNYLVVSQAGLFGQCENEESSKLAKAQVYSRRDGWHTRQTLYYELSKESADAKESNIDRGPNKCGSIYGSAVAINEAGSVIVIGSYSMSDVSQGAVHVFARNLKTGKWSKKQTLLADRAKENLVYSFGSSVAISKDNTIVVGAPSSGIVYVFVETKDLWKQRQILHANSKIANSKILPKGFGWSVGISQNDTIVVGSNVDDNYDTNTEGYVYVFQKRKRYEIWEEEAKLQSGRTGDGFGSSVSISQDTILVGANSDSTIEKNAGGAYVFKRFGFDWVLQQKLYPTIPMDAASLQTKPCWFGSSVSIRNNIIVVGAEGDERATGAAYVFHLVNNRTYSKWESMQKLRSNLPTEHEYFGWKVSVSEDIILIGKEGKTVHVFEPSNIQTKSSWL